MSKIGLIIKTRNGVTKAGMILDTKESGVRRVTVKSQRVILPRLLDSVLRILTMITIPTSSAEAVSGFMLDFSGACRRIPLKLEEGCFYCATVVLNKNVGV